MALAEEDILLDKRETCKFFGGPENPIDASTLYRGIKRGYYPHPLRVGPKLSRWSLKECKAARQAMIDARNKERKPNG